MRKKNLSGFKAAFPSVRYPALVYLYACAVVVRCLGALLCGWLERKRKKELDLKRSPYGGLFPLWRIFDSENQSERLKSDYK